MSGLPLVVVSLIFGGLWLAEALFGGIRYPAPCAVIGLFFLALGVLHGYPVLLEIREVQARWPGGVTSAAQPEPLQEEQAA